MRWGRRALIAAAALSAVASHASATALLVPAYFHPADHAAEWAALATAAPRVSVTAIFNPASGPGTSTDAAYAPALAALRAAGGRALGYVHTQNADGSLRAAATVHAEVDAYATLYGTIDGIFVDEMTSNLANAPYYASLYTYVKSNHAGYTVVGNPGTDVPQAYAAAADVLVTAEDFQSAYADYTPRSWTQSKPASGFASILHDAPASTLSATLAQAQAQNVGYVYVTDDGADGNPYDSLPSYWLAEVNAVSAPEPATLASIASIGLVTLRRRRRQEETNS